MTPEDIRNHIATTCGFTPGLPPNKAQQGETRIEPYGSGFAIVWKDDEYPNGENWEGGYETFEAAKRAAIQQGEPTSFSAWLERNGDSIEPLDRTEATAQWFDEKAEHENDLRQESLRDFETWETDQQGE